GNIGTSGRIYHRPGQRDYAATRISAAKGEAFFCSEADAIAAGFRAARR
ncbi:MAG: thermonuclease family protein, partial [Rhodobacterales bacterium]|nr:thermonuclease family protein [Rhodobacterales bacterium]